MPTLQVSLPDGSEVTHELTDDVISIGRVSDNAIQIEDASVSSHHAELHQSGSEYMLKDIGSTNGTQVNARAVAADEETSLHHGDQIVFGNIRVRYLSEVGSEQAPMPQESEPSLTPATTSVAPTDFSNASPFPKKASQRDNSAVAVMAFGVVAVLAAVGAMVFIFQMKSPL